MQRDIIKDLLSEKLEREQHQADLNDALQKRLQDTVVSEGLLADGQDNSTLKFRIRDYTTLEQVDQLHRNVESVKKNLSEDTDYMTEEMNALIAKVDDAVRTIQGRPTNIGDAAVTQIQQDQDVHA